MGANKKVSTVPITIRFTEARINQLKKLSHLLSIERHDDLSYIDLIREAIDKVFPVEDKKNGKI